MVFETKCLGFAFGCGLVTQFAAKTYNPENSTRKEWIGELEIQMNMEHKNILPCYGVTKNYFVMKYMNSGTLHDFLIEYETQLSLKNMHFISSELADGLVYLASKGIIHGDFHSRNILVSLKNNQIAIRISDFGNSKVLALGETNPSVKSDVDNFLSILFLLYPKHRVNLKNALNEHCKKDPEGFNFIVEKKWIAIINEIESPKTILF